ncbi:MAG: bifunctional nuclease family protein [Planctomycetota bacterium]
MNVEMKLARIIISELTDNQVIYLQEVGGERQFPIMIGIFEATNIDRRVNDTFLKVRPLTHDLIVSVAEALDATVEKVVISDLSDHTYYAQLHVRTPSGEVLEIDSRPSDAIAVAVTFQPPLPIFVSEEVLDDALSPQDDG